MRFGWQSIVFCSLYYCKPNVCFTNFASIFPDSQMLWRWFYVIPHWNRRKTPSIKIKDGTHPSKVQGKWEHKYTQPQEKTKANNQQKSGKDPMQRGLVTIKKQSTITKKTLTKEFSSATNQLAMKVHYLWYVEEMRNLDQVQEPAKKLLSLAHIVRLWTHIDDSEKQASRGLKKTTYRVW